VKTQKRACRSTQSQVDVDENLLMLSSNGHNLRQIIREAQRQAIREAQRQGGVGEENMV